MRQYIFRIIPFVMILFFYHSELLSKSYFQQIHEEKLKGDLSDSEALYLRALGMYAPDQVPDEYESYPVEIIKSGFGTAVEIGRNWGSFTPNQQEILNTYFGRFSTDTSYVSPRGLFRIHFDFSGYHGVDTTDSDFDNIPDYVEAVAMSADSVYYKEVEVLGLKAPLSDNGQYGPEWDIYIQNLPRIYGYTQDEQKMGSNPDVYSGFMVIDNDYTHTPTKGLGAMRVTVAHEFFHMIHMAYHLRPLLPDLFIMEASSTWMEDYVYDNVNDYYYYLEKFFLYNNRPFDYRGNNHEYGLSIWFHYLQKKLGSPDVVREMWEAIVDLPALDALNYVLSNHYQVSFEDALTEFYSWNIMTGTRADTLHFYPEGESYPEVTLDDNVDFVTDAMVESYVQRLSVRYFSFVNDDAEQIILAPVNTLRSNTNGVCQIHIHEGAPKPFYKSLTDDLYVTLVSEDESPWQMAAGFINSESHWDITQFAELKEGFSASISGQVFHDLNADGVYQQDEPGLNDIVINLYEAGGDSLIHTEDDVEFYGQLTDTTGSFLFTKLFSGNYFLSVDLSTLPDRMLFSTNNEFDMIQVNDTLSVENIRWGFRSFEEKELPVAIPQPFFPEVNDHVKIPYVSLDAGYVYLTLFSSGGYHIVGYEIMNNESGIQMFEWDGRDADGDVVPSGIYYYVIQQNEKLLRKNKIAVIR